MYILDVIPTVKIPKGVSQVLSYFSKDELKPGTLVSVPLGRAKVNALVVSSYPLDGEKINIRKSGFQMKNIERVISREPLLSERQIKLFLWFLKYYSSPVGLSAKTFLPSYVIKKRTEIKDIKPVSMKINESDTGKDTLVFGEKREAYYKKEIKEALRSNKQVLLLVPDMLSLDHYADALSELSPIVISSELSPKKYFDAWKKIRNGETKFVIATRMGVFLNFSKLGLVILDQEDDQAYKSRDMMPYYHTKGVALKLSELFSAKLIYGSATPSIETYWLAKTKKIDTTHLETRSPNRSPMLVDMRNEIHGGNYSILSWQLQNDLEDILSKKKQAIFFISRKGAETFVFCRDCGYVEKCPKCDSSLIHHKERNTSVLMCHQCGYKKDIQLRCPKCQSHRIKYFGAGTQMAKEEVIKLFPDAKVEILDSDITPTKKEQKKALDDLRDKKIDILIGTQLLFKKYDMPKADLAAILSLDNLLYAPDFRSGERVFNILVKMSYFCKKSGKFYLQTYTQENPVLELCLRLDRDSFYKSEIAARKLFFYPPFAKLIRLSFKNKEKHFAEAEAVKLSEKLKKLAGENVQVLGPAPATIPKVRNEYIFQIILKIKTSEDMENKKTTLLRNVPEGWLVDVDPDSL